VSRFVNLLLISVLFLLACGGTPESLKQPAIIDLFADTFQSPDTGCHQGYATDGTSHFLFDTHRILKRANDATWHITGVNDQPFDGLAGFDHMGDGDYFEGSLYAPVEQYSSCTSDSNPAIFMFDAVTLLRTRVIDLPSAEEVSALAVKADARELWVASYCDGRKLWVYDLDSFALKGAVWLDPALSGIQGVAYRDGYFYVAQNDGVIQRVSLSGKTTPIFHTTAPGAHEGLDYSQGELRWLIDGGFGEQKVHFLVPK